jgi:hypothetical protein
VFPGGDDTVAEEAAPRPPHGRHGHLAAGQAEAGGLTKPTPGCCMQMGSHIGWESTFLNDLAPLIGGAFLFSRMRAL